jgi:hypothetical protein
VSRRNRSAELAFSLTSWDDIGNAPKVRDKDSVPQVIMLRGRYDSGNETLPHACWWDDHKQAWGGWPYLGVLPSHWMEMVPLPPVPEPVSTPAINPEGGNPP